MLMFHRNQLQQLRCSSCWQTLIVLSVFYWTSAASAENTSVQGFLQKPGLPPVLRGTQTLQRIADLKRLQELHRRDEKTDGDRRDETDETKPLHWDESFGDSLMSLAAMALGQNRSYNFSINMHNKITFLYQYSTLRLL